MIEFGSDFHHISSFNSNWTHLVDAYSGAILLADGRQCIVVLIRQYGWKRIWMPDYFCYEVIETIKEKTGIEVRFYEDSPLREENVEKLPFERGDVLLRMNFFGMRGWRSNKRISCPVIEDHTHALLGDWASNSDADWCISSVRKSLPLPEGGMMWSPKGNRLTVEVDSSGENERIAATRWEGMDLKASYLKGEDVCKDEFRKRITETEEYFDRAEPALLDKRSMDVVSKKLDINLWLEAKRRNWHMLKDMVHSAHCEVLVPETEDCTMFSMVLLFGNKVNRDSVRKRLIENRVYPAILWAVPESASAESRSFSERMLSVHCDGRYDEEDIHQLAGILNDALKAI